MPRATTAPLFDWLRERSAGVLLHPTSLHGEQGVGTLGAEARAWTEYLAAAGFSWWQLCPLGPTGYGDSPYSPFSAAAGNPYLIDLQALVDEGWLEEDDLLPLRAIEASAVDYGLLQERKWAALRRAHAAYVRRGRPADTPWGRMEDFQTRQRSWLEPVCLFLALKRQHGGAPWHDWPAELRTHARASRRRPSDAVLAEADFHAFCQWIFDAQWAALRRHAAALGVGIIGDTPLYVAWDSADVWSQPELFELERKTLSPLAVAGCPPDYFAADGQLWGNPLYDWAVHASDGYRWWLDRIARNLELCDVLRLDHFRGFDTYWRIPAGSANARPGRWIEGPGLGFFRAVQARFPGCQLIAEDLGDLLPSVHELRRATGLPGMTVLQFAWGGGADNLYLPHNIGKDSVVYPGTHDNDTTAGWYASADEATRDHVRRYLRVDGRDLSWDFVRAAYASAGRLAILPAQDLLQLGSEARFNRPGTVGGNWAWRCTRRQFDLLAATSPSYLWEIGRLYGRLPAAPAPHAEP